ncbi:MAG TPA: hypothetical protein DCS43_01485 [Verrucomicrobia bacterium]|nr:hypothetical protein [Verrucomicrobiota bacterium]
MKKLTLCMMTLAFTAALTSSALASSIAGKVWYADCKLLDDAALMYGGTASLSLSENLWISGMYLMGTYDDVLGLSGLAWDSADGEALLGYSFPFVDVGVGGRYSLWTLGFLGAEEEYQIFGPMAYIGAGSSFGDSPLGWYVGGSYMFKDFGDADDSEDTDDGFEHYNIEGGLFLSLEPVSLTVGYRLKEYVNLDDLEFKGITATLGFGF